MVSNSEAAKADYESKPLRGSAFGAGEDEGSSVAAGQTAEVAVVEVGASSGNEAQETGALSEYITWLAGDRSDKELRSGLGKAFMNAQDGGSADLPLDTEFKLVARRRRERGGRDLTDWVTHGELRDPDEKGELPIDPGKPIVKEGRVIALHMRNEGSAVTFDLSNSTFKYPGRAGK